MTRRIVSNWCFEWGRRGSHAGTFELLTHVPNSRAETRGLLGEFLIIRKQVTVSREHRTATACVRNDWRVAFESDKVLSGELARAVKISGVRVQRTTTNLFRRSSDIEIVRA